MKNIKFEQTPVGGIPKWERKEKIEGYLEEIDRW